MSVEEKVLAYHQKRLEKFMAKFDYCKIIKTETTRKELNVDIIQITVKTLLMMQGWTQAYETKANVKLDKQNECENEGR